MRMNTTYQDISEVANYLKAQRYAQSMSTINAALAESTRAVGFFATCCEMKAARLWRGAFVHVKEKNHR